MHLTFRTKLIGIAGAAALAFVVLMVASTLISNRVERQLDKIQQLYVPKVELGPTLERQFERISRGIQDAVAARDRDALAATEALEREFFEQLDGAGPAVAPADAEALRAAMQDYYATSVAIARRLIAGETGEALVEAMGDMQGKQRRVAERLVAATRLDRGELAQAFERATLDQAQGTRFRLVISLVCLAVVLLLSLWLSRGLLRSLASLGAGFRRFGAGDFDHLIPVAGNDELADAARQANHMARSLQKLAEDRDREDWIKAGHAGLNRELRGELSEKEAAERALRFLARYVEAPAGALYFSAEDGRLELLAHHALSPAADGRLPPPTFRPGEGLVGEAARQDEIHTVRDPPPSYLVVSGLGQAAPREIALVPIVHLGKPTGVLELAFFKPLSPTGRELLLSVRETLAIALDVCRRRAQTAELLVETQELAHRLASQEEELRSTNEELRTQQEELRRSNEELTQQAEELELARRGLERKAEELATVSTYKSQFLTNMSHELRTPLNSMLLLSSLLEENESRTLTDKQVEYVRTIHGAGKDLLALINQVLDLAKVESGKQQIRVEPASLESAAARARRMFEPLAKERGLKLLVEVLPGTPGIITTDPLRLEQILTNLLGNAIKFTPQGGVTLRIGRAEAGARFRRADLEAATTVAFVVADTGPGIAPEHQQRIFAPFEQVDGKPDRRYGGTGLGLALAKELAELLGGEIQLLSVPGRGSTFTCYLPESPRPESEPRPDPVVPDLAPAPAPVADDREPCLLLIEDDVAFASTFADIIEAQGITCLQARDGSSGLALARERLPSGIILDVKLPDIDGFAVMAQLAADPRTSGIPVHFVSALEGAERGLALGAVGYLQKPTSRRDLLRVIESLASRIPRSQSRILVVEDDAFTGESLVRQLTAEGLEAIQVKSAGEALKALGKSRFGCMILDLTLPDMDGLDLLARIQEQQGAEMPSVVVYTGRALSKAEAQRLEAYADAIVVKEGPSAERLLNEIRLFVRRLKEGLAPRRPMVPRLSPADVRLGGRRVLVVDDDMRTLYALSATLRAKGVEVFTADTGKAALEELQRHPEVDAVLMDIMMPEMDGYEAIRHIRGIDRFRNLPVVALTAKAMKGDEEKCLEAGATAYLPKPIDAEKLLALLHARLSS